MHGIGGVDVVLDQHGNAVQRPAHFSVLAFRVELVGDLQCIGIELDDGMQRRSGRVDGGDTVEVQLHDGVGGQFAGSHAALKVADTGFLQHERGVRIRCRRKVRPGKRQDAEEDQCDAIHAYPRQLAAPATADSCLVVDARVQRDGGMRSRLGQPTRTSVWSGSDSANSYMPHGLFSGVRPRREASSSTSSV